MPKHAGLRIIAGRYKGRRLKTIDAPGTRPMTDRVRENLFNILAPELEGARLLDLFAGSGAVGIEALSRGAAAALFVESERAWADIITANLDDLGLRTSSLVMRTDAYKAVESLGSSGQEFGIVFAGAPYDTDHHNRILAAVHAAGICRLGTIVLQYRAGDPLQTPTGYGIDTRTYGITALSFLRYSDA
ncbi:MAG TPA: 16S rRNA (guanine(966)-N(2))-methyltransferase RsmD [Acidobacteriota bacterium]|nr:16S rRNA (guanine(966)-N(2))-methyltransferase RsmD [Acidobacteriota bacterium]